MRTATNRDHDIRKGPRGRDLSGRVITPSNDRPVSKRYCQTVVIARPDFRYAGESRWNHRLAGIKSFGVGIVSPCDHRPVAAQSQAVFAAGSYRHGIRQAGWDIDLSRIVVAPANDRAIAL